MISNTTRISWSEPVQPNGVIVEYRMTILGNGALVDEIIVNSDESRLEVNLGN